MTFQSGQDSQRRLRRADVKSIGVRMSADELRALDVFCARQGDISRPEAIRMLVRDGLAQSDTMPTNPDQQSTVSAESEMLQPMETMADSLEGAG